MTEASPASAETPTHARGLQERLIRQFETDRSVSASRFEAMAEALASGTFTGAPVPRPRADALLALLERLSWQGGPDDLMRAMSYQPETFGLDEIRNVLARLGFAALPGTIGNHEHFPALALDREGRLHALDRVDGQVVRLPAPGSDACPLDSGSELVRTGFFRLQRLSNETEVREGQSWFGALLRRFGGMLSRLFFVHAAINLSLLITSFGVMAIYDMVIPSTNTATLAAILAGVAFAALLEAALRHIRARQIGHVSARIEYLVGTEAFARVLSLPLERLSIVPIGTQLTRFRQFEMTRDLITVIFCGILLDLPLFLIFLAGLFWISPLLGFVLLAASAVILSVGLLIFPELRRRSLAGLPAQRHLQSLLLDSVAYARAIRASGCGPVFADKLGQALRESMQNGQRLSHLQDMLRSISAISTPLAVTAVVFAGALLAIDGALSIGALVACSIVVSRAMAPLQAFLLGLLRFGQLKQISHQIDALMAQPPAAQAIEGDVPRAFSGALSVDRLFYRHAGTAEAALNGISFEVKAGEFIALTGGSGAGKSTLLSTILQISPPQSGAVRLDGIDLRQIPASERRTAFSYLPAEPVLLAGTLAENLRFSVPMASDDELMAALEEMGIADVVRMLPGGIHTQFDAALLEQLPLGLRQGLSIVQSLIVHTPVLLVDQGGRVLDARIERLFLQALRRRKGRQTIVMATHSLECAALADRILHLQSGRVAAFEPTDRILPRLQALHGAA